MLIITGGRHKYLKEKHELKLCKEADRDANAEKY
jgi:hypothetical protein